MIRAVFEKEGTGFTGFILSGHAGYAAAGADIVCAAVSAMANLVCNAAEAFGAEAEIQQDGEDALLSYRLTNRCEEAEKLLAVFCEELRQLESQYPGNVRVTKK